MARNVRADRRACGMADFISLRQGNGDERRGGWEEYANGRMVCDNPPPPPQNSKLPRHMCEPFQKGHVARRSARTAPPLFWPKVEGSTPFCRYYSFEFRIKYMQRAYKDTVKLPKGRVVDCTTSLSLWRLENSWRRPQEPCSASILAKSRGCSIGPNIW